MTTRRERLLGWAASQGDHAGRAVKRALDLADQAHSGQRRYNGENHIEHPLAVALILTEHGADVDTVGAALLHETPLALTGQPVAHIRQRLGGTIVDLVGEFDRLDRQGCAHPEQFDERALKIKVADRLHNMRTIEALHATKQRDKADNTRDLVAPLARLVGMDGVASELDNLAAATLAGLGPIRPAGEHAAVGISLRALRLAALLLPAECRERWVIDWHGELHALPTRRQRLGFVLDVLAGLPTMAVLTRRTDLR